FFFQAEDGIRDFHVTGVQTCALPISVGAREVGGGAPVHLVVHGPAGCGKSAVAVRAANLLEAGDGRLFAVLGDRAPGAVLEDLLRSLGWPDGAVPPTLDERVRLYRRLTSARRLVVVLDDATGETQVRPLLPTGPGSVTIVTSRSPLAGPEAARPYELELGRASGRGGGEEWAGDAAGQ